ncbi:MAG: SEC-C domain-containing protein [Nitrospirae bacterium]|nr:SEC-C domain-containing protein [Nitrospirota bacterium]
MLVTQIFISRPFLDSTPKTEVDEIITCKKEYMGIWDTGATNSVISQKVIDECGLKPTGMTQVRHAGSDTPIDVETYLVSIFLPNKVIITAIRATKGYAGEFDILIGMDVINQGDFAITHHTGNTTFSFRLPSKEKIDFVKQRPEPIHSTKVSRNAPCTCGSGKKYKKCCGKNI